MTARHYYRNDDGDMEAVDAVLRWSYQGSEKANEGEAGTWEAVVDDPGMTLDFVGHRRWIVYEDESDDENELLLDGITQAARIAHTGGDVTNPTGRVWIIEIADLNTLFTYRLMTGSDSQRPDETDIERVLDIIGSEEMGYVDDLTYVSAGDPTDMDAANVRGQFTGQVFDQAAQESSKNYWLGSYGTIAGGATMFVFYDHDSSSAYTSPLALSNNPADLDMAAFDEGTAAVLPIGKDTELRRDYARVYDGAYGAFQGGAKYIGRDENPDPPNITVSGRDIAYPAPEVTRRSTMKARLLRVLARHKTPDQVIKTTLFGVHARQATMVRKGMRISTTATHLPGYGSGRYLRILSAQPKPVGARYDIALELQGPGTEPPSCSTALASREYVGEEGPFSAVESTITPTFDGLILSFQEATNPNTPASTAMTTPSGYTALQSVSAIGSSTFVISRKAAAAGVGSTASSTYSPGHGSFGEWASYQVALNIPSAAPVQDSYSAGISTTLGATPAVGNILVMFMLASTFGGGASTPAGWTEVFHYIDGPSDVEMIVAIKCAEEGESDTFSWLNSGGSTLACATWVGEWAVA